MPFKINKATLNINKAELETLVREAVQKEGYKPGKLTFVFFDGGRGQEPSVSVNVEVD